MVTFTFVYMHNEINTFDLLLIERVMLIDHNTNFRFQYIRTDIPKQINKFIEN